MPLEMPDTVRDGSDSTVGVQAVQAAKLVYHPALVVRHRAGEDPPSWIGKRIVEMHVWFAGEALDDIAQLAAAPGCDAGVRPSRGAGRHLPGK